MNKLIYLFKRFINMDFYGLFRLIGSTAKKSKKNPVYIFFDMLICAFKYSAAPTDYALFEFYNIDHGKRSSFITRGINNQLVKKYNDKNSIHIFDNKDEFNQIYADYIKRDWIRVDTADYEEFKAFLSKHQTFFYKPVNLSCGMGIEKIVLSDSIDPEALYEDLKSRGRGICEQAIIQHPVMNSIYPDSVNTIRFVTIHHNNKTNIIFAFLRVGNNGKAVDNLNNGGIAAPIDLTTGRISHPGSDKKNIPYDFHPKTKVAFVGFQIPLFEEAKDMIIKASLINPQIGYAGWDIAITDDSPCLVEGNYYPGHDILQLPAHIPDRIGLMSKVKDFL